MDDVDILKMFLYISRVNYDGHFTIYGFTKSVRVTFGSHPMGIGNNCFFKDDDLKWDEDSLQEFIKSIPVSDNIFQGMERAIKNELRRLK